MLDSNVSDSNSSASPIWEYRVGTPSRATKDWVASYSGYREDVGRPVCRLETPKDRIILILGFGDCLHISPVDTKLESPGYSAFVVGLSDTPMLTQYDGAQQGIEVELLPWVADRLFGVAARELTQGVVQLETLWGNHMHWLLEQLRERSSWKQRFALVDRFLQTQFASSDRTIRPEICWAWQQLEQYKGCVPIHYLAECIGWSDRHFAACFREQIGLSPKNAARRIRFNRAQQLLTAPTPYSLSDIAISCGYSDQSHFTREFHAFAHCSPATYQKAQFDDLEGIPGDVLNAKARSNLFKT